MNKYAQIYLERLNWVHESPERYKTLSPQKYETIKSTRNKDYPIDQRIEYEKAIKKALGISDESKSFTSFALDGYNSMPEKGGNKHTKSFSRDDLKKIYFESVRDENEPVGGVGIKGLKAAIRDYVNNPQKITETGNLKIYPRVEAYVPFDVAPDKVE
jgi:thymidylate synthase